MRRRHASHITVVLSKAAHSGPVVCLRARVAPPLVGSRSPDGWDQIPRWAGGWACTSHPGVLGSIPKYEEPGKTGRHPVLKYRVPPGSQMGRERVLLLVLNSVTSTPQRLCLLRHLGFLTSPHASPTCRRRRVNSYRLLRRSTPGPPPIPWAHLFHLPASPRPPLCTPTMTT